MTKLCTAHIRQRDLGFRGHTLELELYSQSTPAAMAWCGCLILDFVEFPLRTVRVVIGSRASSRPILDFYSYQGNRELDARVQITGTVQRHARSGK